MGNRKRSPSAEPTPSTEIVTTEPQLVEPGEYSSKHKVVVFQAVDYLGSRFRLGDHVAMYTGEGREWVCVLETLYKDPKTGEAKFKGRWFWSVADIVEMKGSAGEPMRGSKNEAHELLCCDNRDTNLVESISRKCCILSYENFQLVKRVVTRAGSRWSKIYFCERQYYHKALRFSELGAMLFPGDPIPPDLRAAAGLPQLPAARIPHDVDADADAYREPAYSERARRNPPSSLDDKDDPVIGDPLLIW